MGTWEYQRIQKSLSQLMRSEKRQDLRLTQREWEAYKKAVLACKSTVSNYNPDR